MKRVPCPKCQHLIAFDETRYSAGQTLVFVCEQCKKQFTIRIGTGKLRSAPKEENWDRIEKEAVEHGLGCLIVVENVFAYKQVLPLCEGENLIGRKDAGTSVTLPIETSDRSMDRKHCYLHVARNKQGQLTYTLRDFPSITGTFLQNRILDDKERAILHDGDVITLGATSLIFRSAAESE